MPPKRAVFTITGGRSGTAWLSKFLARNLEDAEVHHELLGPGFWGTTTPGLFETTEFNEFGVTKRLREFWTRKFSIIDACSANVYAETNHLLAKSGLLENLDLCPCPVTIIILRRARLRTVASYIKVGAMAEPINMWLWFLSPAYKNNIVPFDQYVNKPGGAQFWYFDEVEARQNFYFHSMPNWLDQTRNDHVFEAHLEDLVNPDMTAHQNFFPSTGLWPFKRDETELPSRCNSTSHADEVERFVHTAQASFPSPHRAAELGRGFSVQKWCDLHGLPLKH